MSLLLNLASIDADNEDNEMEESLEDFDRQDFDLSLWIKLKLLVYICLPLFSESASVGGISLWLLK